MSTAAGSQPQHGTCKRSSSAAAQVHPPFLQHTRSQAKLVLSKVHWHCSPAAQHWDFLLFGHGTAQGSTPSSRLYISRVQKVLTGPGRQERPDTHCNTPAQGGSGRRRVQPASHATLQRHWVQTASPCRPPLASGCAIFAAVTIHQPWSGRPESKQVGSWISDTPKPASSSKACASKRVNLHAR